MSNENALIYKAYIKQNIDKIKFYISYSIKDWLFPTLNNNTISTKTLISILQIVSFCLMDKLLLLKTKRIEFYLMENISIKASENTKGCSAN